jgi:exodeoxyribonuclease V alpha subunit
MDLPQSKGSTERSTILNQLFPKAFHVLHEQLAKQKSFTAAEKQRLICEWLDIVDSEGIDWSAVISALETPAKSSCLLETLIPDSHCLNGQKVAVASAMQQKFSVITGGPGTGKTTTVTKLLAALIWAEAPKKPHIALVAPTGKAAARLSESIAQAVEQLPIDPQIKAAIPIQASTLHRLLGAISGSAEFRHNAANPLHLDVLVVDEASMVDLPLLYKLLTALPVHAKLILLGDKDQLASVEAGGVLGDLCSFLSFGQSQQHAQRLVELTGHTPLLSQVQKAVPAIADSVSLLSKSYRFHARSGIGVLARAVNNSDITAMNRVLDTAQFGDISASNLSQESYNQALTLICRDYGEYLKLASESVQDQESEVARAKKVLASLQETQVLVAMREGNFGVNTINERIETLLIRRGSLRTQGELWYHGRPVMVNRNDHNIGLFNGDIGVCLRDAGGRLKVYFDQGNGDVRGILPSRVPSHETVYAMTIHKSQGSEFKKVWMLLPDSINPLLTKELIYTGITRAKQHLHLLADRDVLQRAICVKTERISGLVDLLMK